MPALFWSMRVAGLFLLVSKRSIRIWNTDQGETAVSVDGNGIVTILTKKWGYYPVYARCADPAIKHTHQNGAPQRPVFKCVIIVPFQMIRSLQKPV